MSSVANYNGKQPNNTSYIKNFVPGTSPNIWQVLQYNPVTGENKGIITPTSTTNKDLYITGNLYVNESIINPSDINLKKDIKPITDVQANNILQLTPSEFVFKLTPLIKHYGFIAQEFESFYPELVFERPAMRGQPKVKSINYLEIIPLLVKKMQLMQEEINSLKGNVTTLNNSVNTINPNITTLNTSVNTLNTNVSSLDTKVNTIDTNIVSLNTSVNTLTTNNTSLTSNISTLNTNFSALDTKVNTLDTTVGTLNTSVGTLNTSVGTLSGSVGALNTAVGPVTPNVGALTTYVKNLNDIVGPKKAGLGELTTEVEALKTNGGGSSTPDITQLTTAVDLLVNHDKGLVEYVKNMEDSDGTNIYKDPNTGDTAVIQLKKVLGITDSR